MEVTKWLKPSDSVSRNTVTARFYAVWAMPARQRGGRGFTKICSLGITVTDKLTIAVTFHPERGYVGTAPDLRQPVIALSLGGLRRKIEAAMLPDKVIVMQLDKAARLERDRRRFTGRPRPGFAGTSA
jgi:hypothetical protein